MSDSAIMLALVERIGDNVDVIAVDIKTLTAKVADLEARLTALETRLAGYGKEIGIMKREGSASAGWRKWLDKWLKWIIGFLLAGGGGGAALINQMEVDNGNRGPGSGAVAEPARPAPADPGLPVVHGPHKHPDD